VKLTFNGKETYAEDAESVSSLTKGFFGKVKSGKVFVSPEEALYLMDNRNAECTDEKGKHIP